MFKAQLKLHVSFLCNCMQDSFFFFFSLICAAVKETHKYLQFAGAKTTSLWITRGKMSRGNTKWVSLGFFCNPSQAADMFPVGGEGGTIWAAKLKPFFLYPQINSPCERPVLWLTLLQRSRCGGGSGAWPASSFPTKIPWKRSFLSGFEERGEIWRLLRPRWLAAAPKNTLINAHECLQTARSLGWGHYHASVGWPAYAARTHLPQAQGKRP